jgi:hypothetical protein
MHIGRLLRSWRNSLYGNLGILSVLVLWFVCLYTRSIPRYIIDRLNRELTGSYVLWIYILVYSLLIPRQWGQCRHPSTPFMGGLPWGQYLPHSPSSSWWGKAIWSSLVIHLEHTASPFSMIAIGRSSLLHLAQRITIFMWNEIKLFSFIYGI